MSSGLNYARAGATSKELLGQAKREHKDFLCLCFLRQAFSQFSDFHFMYQTHFLIILKTIFKKVQRGIFKRKVGIITDAVEVLIF